jgi:hypothetical protein
VGAAAKSASPRKKVILAIANKLARIAQAALSSGKDYQHPLSGGK